jgi:hypothetical protein
MAVYVDKARLQQIMPPDRLDRLFTIRVPGPEPGSSLPVVDDTAIERVCTRADTLTTSAVSAFYSGPHPVTAPEPYKLLEEIAMLYAEAYAYQRDPSVARTYVDVSKSPQFKQAEMLACQLQTGKRNLFDNVGQPHAIGGVVSGLTNRDGSPPPLLFGDDYQGDL